jgi:hypothetical protein
MRGGGAPRSMIYDIQEVAFVPFCVLSHDSLLLPQLPTATPTLRALLLVSPYPSDHDNRRPLRWIRRRDRSAISKIILRSAQPPAVISPLSAYPSCSFDCGICRGQSSFKRPRLAIPQQNSEDLRFERERHDEPAHRRQEPRTS